MQISMPIFMIGYKDKIVHDREEAVRRHIAIEILLNMLLGESSSLYSKLYKNGDLSIVPDFDYEFSSQYSHILISGRAKEPEKIKEELAKEVKNMTENGINEESLERTKKKIYGQYVTEYNNVADIARMFLSDWMKGINSFEYIEAFEKINAEFVKNILKEAFDEENMILSVVKGKNK